MMGMMEGMEMSPDMMSAFTMDSESMDMGSMMESMGGAMEDMGTKGMADMDSSMGMDMGAMFEMSKSMGEAFGGAGGGGDGGMINEGGMQGGDGDQKKYGG